MSWGGSRPDLTAPRVKPMGVDVSQLRTSPADGPTSIGQPVSGKHHEAGAPRDTWRIGWINDTTMSPHLSGTSEAIRSHSQSPQRDDESISSTEHRDGTRKDTEPTVPHAGAKTCTTCATFFGPYHACDGAETCLSFQELSEAGAKVECKY